MQAESPASAASSDINLHSNFDGVVDLDPEISHPQRRQRNGSSQAFPDLVPRDSTLGGHIFRDPRRLTFYDLSSPALPLPTFDDEESLV
jgi:hypothetical protein